MPASMIAKIDRVEVIRPVQRRRRWSVEKARIVQETCAPRHRSRLAFYVRTQLICQLHAAPEGQRQKGGHASGRPSREIVWHELRQSEQWQRPITGW